MVYLGKAKYLVLLSEAVINSLSWQENDRAHERAPVLM